MSEESEELKEAIGMTNGDWTPVFIYVIAMTIFFTAIGVNL